MQLLFVGLGVGQVLLELIDNVLSLFNKLLILLFCLFNCRVHILKFLVLFLQALVLPLGFLESKLDLDSFIDSLLQRVVKVF